MKKTVVCLGDSNTHGYCSATGGRFDESTRWPCVLQDLLIIMLGTNDTKARFSCGA